jgi:hypothetical protein
MHVVPLLAAVTIAVVSAPAIAHAAPPPATPAVGDAQRFTLYDGSKVTLGPDGLGTRTDASGKNTRPFAMVLPQGRTALGDQPGPSREALLRRLSVLQRTGTTGDVLVGLSAAQLDGKALGSGRRAAHTTDAHVNASLRAVGATTAAPMFATTPPAALGSLNRSAASQFGSGSVDLDRMYLVHVTGTTAAQAAVTLRSTPGVSYAAPDQYVSTMDTDPVPLPKWVGSGRAARPNAAAANGLPANYGLQSSLQSYLNANGVNLMGGYADIINRLHQLPGQGEIVTNVSLGDLTDQSMADNGDFYVSQFGPTTVVDSGQRYLDYPSLPRIPTYTVDPAGAVDPLGTVEGVDPYLGEVLLDFSMMAPLPHDLQRPGEVGSGATDLLGIAPGAQYRLVEPAQPTFANIAVAMLAAAQQTPRPDVITASLGFATDSVGFPGRYLEDDPLTRSVISTIVNQYGIAVTISSNDGTRLYTPAGVGPDGGSTPTDRPAHGATPTSINDDATSTTPSVVPDTGAIDVGGTTTDDTIAVPPQAGGPLSRTGTLAETRLDGMTAFSSGFGSRVDVSAPSDNIPALMHECLNFGNCSPSDAVTSLSGGTSASAPMTAAAVADLLQIGKATGHPLTPQAVRQVLEETGRAVPTQPQVDRQLHVGPQIDITRAVEKLLGGPSHGNPSIVRMSTAHRVSVGNAGANFVENTDPGAIDLSGPADVFGNPTGESLVGPITFGLDVTDLPRNEPLRYVLRVGQTEFGSETPAIRVLPAQLLAAAGQPVASTSDRSIAVTAEVRGSNDKVLAQSSETLTLGPSDGTHAMAPAPVVAPVTAAGAPVAVHYDLTGVTDVNDPQLIISSISHWSPYSAPLYRIAYAATLSGTTGTVSVPASVFSAGGGVYGAAILQDSPRRIGGVAVPFRIAGSSADQRPDAPTLAAAGGAYGHQATLSRAAPTLRVKWDVGNVDGASGAALEVSAPGPTIYNLLNTFTNQFGTTRDANGVDSPSTAWINLPGTSGTTNLDLLKLGIPTSLNYTVRVVATRHGQPAGQASSASSLEFDDGLVPDGGTVADFDINPGGASTVATATLGSTGAPTSSTLTSYDPATGGYGAAYAHDTSGENAYFLYGNDPGAHRLVAASYPWSGTEQHLLTYDTTDRHQVSDQPVDLNSQYNLIVGRVDPQRGRTDLLAWRGGDQADVVVPMNTATGALGAPVVADNGTPGGHFYTMLDVQQASGKVDLGGSLLGDLCVIRRAGFTTVDVDAGTAAPMTATNRCMTGLASDHAGHAELTVGPLYSYPMLPAARLQQADETTGTVGALQDLGARSPMFPTVDTAHGLLVVGFLGGTDWQVNNNGMSAVGAYDLHTGAQVSFSERFNLFSAYGGLVADFGALQGERGIQLDPATRTGWTYSPYGNQVQQFHY